MLPIAKLQELASAGKKVVEIGGVAHSLLASGAHMLVKTAAGNLQARPSGVPGKVEREGWAEQKIAPASMNDAMAAFVAGFVSDRKKGDSELAEEAMQKMAKEAWAVISAYEVKASISTSKVEVNVVEKNPPVKPEGKKEK